ncbi:MAG: hypothetical protein AAF386_05895 [Pseudomonadota bacterium]
MHKRKAQITAKNDDDSIHKFTATGRVLWALERLKEGPCTSIEQPAPRWSDYVFRLRGEGVVIETEHRKHGGPYPGTHAVYHLKSDVTISEVTA